MWMVFEKTKTKKCLFFDKIKTNTSFVNAVSLEKDVGRAYFCALCLMVLRVGAFESRRNSHQHSHETKSPEPFYGSGQ